MSGNSQSNPHHDCFRYTEIVLRLLSQPELKIIEETGSPTARQQSVAAELAESIGFCRLFDLELPADVDGSLSPRLAVAASKWAAELINHAMEELIQLPLQFDTASDQFIIDQLIRQPLESRMRFWAIVVAVDEAELAASELGDSEANLIEHGLKQMLQKLESYDRALYAQRQLLSAICDTCLLNNWRHLLKGDYARLLPWWLDGTLESEANAQSLALDQETDFDATSLCNLLTYGVASADARIKRPQFRAFSSDGELSSTVSGTNTNVNLLKTLTWKSRNNQYLASLVLPTEAKSVANLELVLESLSNDNSGDTDQFTDVDVTLQGPISGSAERLAYSRKNHFEISVNRFKTIANPVESATGQFWVPDLYIDGVQWRVLDEKTAPLTGTPHHSKISGFDQSEESSPDSIGGKSTPNGQQNTATVDVGKTSAKIISWTSLKNLSRKVNRKSGSWVPASAVVVVLVLLSPYVDPFHRPAITVTGIKETVRAADGGFTEFQITSRYRGFVTVVAVYRGQSYPVFVEPDLDQNLIAVDPKRGTKYQISTRLGSIPAEALVFVVTETPADSAINHAFQQRKDREQPVPDSTSEMTEYLTKVLRESGYRNVQTVVMTLPRIF